MKTLHLLHHKICLFHDVSNWVTPVAILE